MSPFLAEVVWWRVITFLIAGPLVFGNLCSYLRVRYDLADGYARKMHHIGIMLISAPILAVLPDRQLLPSMIVSSLLLIAISFIAAYSSRPLIAGMALHSMRRRDAPHSRFFFLMPMITSNVAITIAALLFPLSLVKIAFFTVAIADGLAEPVGVRFGRTNQYRVRDPFWVWTNTKSVAGSSTVFLLAATVCAALMAAEGRVGAALVVIPLLFATATTAIEALSPRGMDNMFIMLATPPLLLVAGAAAW